MTYKSIFGDAARKLIKGVSGTAMVLIVLFCRLFMKGPVGGANLIRQEGKWEKK